MSILNETVKQFKNIIAIDTAKNSFQVCVARTDGEGKPKQYKFTRAKFQESVVQFGSKDSLIVMEACSASHHWDITYPEFSAIRRNACEQLLTASDLDTLPERNDKHSSRRSIASWIENNFLCSMF